MSDDERSWENHAADVVATLSTAILRKYQAGQSEHGGKLWRKPMLRHLVAEAVDLNVYLMTHIEQIQIVRELLRKALNKNHAESIKSVVQEALNMLETGNLDGVEEEELNPGVEGDIVANL
jgi:RecJ-like exonuclease